MRSSSKKIQGEIMNTIQQEPKSRPRSVFDSFVYREKQTLWRPYITVRALAALAFIIALTFVLAACSDSGANDLRGKAWELASLSGNGLLPGTAITIEFTDEGVSGSAGCNHYGGSYQVSGNSLTFSDLFWTEMACPEPSGILEQEGAYLAALNDANSYQLASDQLVILDEAGGQRLVFVKPAAGSISQAEEPPGQSDEPETVVIQNATPTPDPEPTATPEVADEPPLPPADLPLGFKPFVDSTAGVSLFLPDSWIVTSVDPGRWAILQSYPEDKYVGGEARQPGDTKCDLNIRPTGTSTDDLIQQWKANPDTTIIFEQEIVLEAGKSGTRLEVESMGRSLSMFTDVHERAVVLTCFGDFAPFDDIAGSLHESEILVDTTQSTDDSSGFQQYLDSEAGVSVDIPGSWVVTGIVPGHRAVLQSYPEEKYVGGEALQPGDTKCDLSIRPPAITMVDFAQEIRANTAITILSEAEIVLASGQPSIVLEVESMGRSLILITEINGRVIVLNCFGELEPFDEIAITLHATD
jgi:heat shock protein HslJ